MISKKFIAKIVSVVLTLAMLAGLAVALTPAHAAEAFEAKSDAQLEADGYVGISTLEELANISATESKQYYLKNDITVADVTGYVIKTAPTTAITIEIDGNGHTVNYSDGKAKGLINNSSNASFIFKNINITGKIEISSDTADNIGALVGTANSGSITLENVHASQDITLTAKLKSYIGGIIGRTSKASLTVKNSSYTGKINTGSGDVEGEPAIGGIIASFIDASATFENVTVKNDITATNDPKATSSKKTYSYIGGILGLSDNSDNDTSMSLYFKNCNASGNINGAINGNPAYAQRSVGGILGKVDLRKKNDENTYVKFENCVNSTNITTNDDSSAGGIAAQCRAASIVQIISCINTGNISDGFKQNNSNWYGVGGILGFYDTIRNASEVNKVALSIENCHNFGAVSGRIAGGILGTTCQVDKPGESAIKNCSNYGEIKATLSAGGIAGSINCNEPNGAATDYTFTNCYNSGAVSCVVASYPAGGILGRTYDTPNSITLTGCYNVASHTAATYSGSMVGNLSQAATFSKCGNTGTRYNLSNEAQSEAFSSGSVTPTLDSCLLSTDAETATNAAALEALLHPASEKKSYNDDGHWDGGCTQENCIFGKATTVTPHIFDNDCDTSCSDCGYTRAASHKLQTKSDENQHWLECSVCNTVSSEGKKDHTFSEAWSLDEENGKHYHACTYSGCTAKKDEADHSFTTEKEKSPATCSSAAKYVKVCECGKEDGIEVPKGEPNATLHVWGDWTANDDGMTHSRKCTVEGCTGYENLGHAGADPTCLKKSKCDLCGTRFGDLADHVFSEDFTPSGAKHYRACTTEGCSERLEYENHTTDPNTPNCMNVATCMKCGRETGKEKGDHIYTKITPTENGHIISCSVEGCTSAQKEAPHEGGTATCVTLAKCSVCNTKYGDYGEHTYNDEYLTDGESHWKACTAGGCKHTSEKEAHSGGTATCLAKAQCSKCSAAYGEDAAHKYVNHACTLCGQIEPTPNPTVDGGCSSSVVGGAVIASTVAALGCAVTFKKKKKK